MGPASSVLMTLCMFYATANQTENEVLKRQQNVAKLITLMSFIAMPGTSACYVLYYWFVPTNPNYIFFRILMGIQNCTQKITYLILGFIFEVIMGRTCIYTFCWFVLFMQMYMLVVKIELLR